MPLSDPYKQFLRRVTQGALDTIEMSQMLNGNGAYGFDDPELRRVGSNIVMGTLAHLFNLAEQNDAHDEMQAVINKIHAGFVGEAS